MRVTVTNVNIPAMSTIGYGEGNTEDGTTVTFVGDHGPMRDLGVALQMGEEVVVDLEDWQIKSSRETAR